MCSASSAESADPVALVTGGWFADEE